jgi:hypothetical protein
MIRRRLSLQLTLVMLLVALAPLAGAGILILNLIEQSITTQVKAGQEQMASAAGALVRNYLNSATTKLKSISAMMRKDEDFPAQMDRLNAQIEPPDLFLEIGYWARNKTDVEVVANAQQLEYSNAQSAARPSSRSFNPRLKQQVPSWSKKSPILQEAFAGNTFVATTNDNDGPYNGLLISVPAVGGAAITASLDLRPLSKILTSVAGSSGRLVLLRDPTGKALASSGADELPPAFINSRHTVGHGGWVIEVGEPVELALAPLRQVRQIGETR